MKRKLRKITTLTLLLISGNVNAQNFYTCIPEDDWLRDKVRKTVSDDYIREEARKVIRDGIWFNNLYDLRNSKDKFKQAQAQIDVDKLWNLVQDNKTSGKLELGIYRVIVAGGKGGNASVDADATYWGTKYCNKWYKGGVGGKGEIRKKVFSLANEASFSAIIGKKGKDGNDSYHPTSDNAGDNGLNGQISSFKIGDIYIKAGYGEGGTGAKADDSWCAHNGKCYCGSGIEGVGYSDGNDGDGYVKIYKYIG